MARPRKIIDIEQLRNLAAKQWSVDEIANHFKVGRDVIYRRFATIIEEARHGGLAKLRDLQWSQAVKGDTSMIKHMSEHYLGQHTKRIHVSEIPDDVFMAEAEKRLKKKMEEDGE